MFAISDCSGAIKNLGNNTGGKEMRQLIQLTEIALQYKTANATAPSTKTDAPASLRVPLYTNSSTLQTRSMTPPNTQVPQIPTPLVPMVNQPRKQPIGTESKSIKLSSNQQHQLTTKYQGHRQTKRHWRAEQEHALN